MVIRIGQKMEKSIFVNEKVIELFLIITRGPLNQLCKTVDMSYAHGFKMMNIWESMGLIEKNKAGYRYNIFYTLRGQRLADEFKVVKGILKRYGVQF
jgi:molybdenum-dependent DNA-binding transcriptional regulator ModE